MFFCDFLHNYFAFRSVCTTFDPLVMVGCASEMKINQNLFCISLGLHYLCIANEENDI